MITITEPKQVEMRLQRRELLSFRQGRPGVTIECEQGVLWVTCPGKYGDHFLIPGDRFETRGRGKVLVEALRDAYLRVEDKN